MRIATPARFGRSRLAFSGYLLTSALLATACTGEFVGRSPGANSMGSNATDSGGGGSTGVGPAPTSVQASWPVDLDGRGSALRRLSRDELLTAMRNLTGQAPPRTDLPEEQRSGHHPLRTSGMAFISSELGKLYRW